MTGSIRWSLDQHTRQPLCLHERVGEEGNSDGGRYPARGRALPPGGVLFGIVATETTERQRILSAFHHIDDEVAFLHPPLWLAGLALNTFQIGTRGVASASSLEPWGRTTMTTNSSKRSPGSKGLGGGTSRFLGLYLPTGYATSEPKRGESPEK